MKKIFTAMLFAGSMSISGPQNAHAGPNLLEEMSLGEFAKLSRRNRDALTTSHAKIVGADEPETGQFIACMGDMAANKDAELNALTVFRWCDAERVVNPEQFASHFNELDAPNLSTAATVTCRNFIRDRVSVEVDFPWVPDLSISLGRHKYRVRSHLTVPGGAGSSVKINYLCELTYDGQGYTLSQESWTLDHLSTF